MYHLIIIMTIACVSQLEHFAPCYNKVVIHIYITEGLYYQQSGYSNIRSSCYIYDRVVIFIYITVR